MDSYYVKNGVKVKANSNARTKRVNEGINDRARKKEEDLRIDKVVVHVTQTEKQIIKELAKSNGMDTSSFIRCLCLYQYNKMAGGMIRWIIGHY